KVGIISRHRRIAIVQKIFRGVAWRHAQASSARLSRRSPRDRISEAKRIFRRENFRRETRDEPEARACRRRRLHANGAAHTLASRQFTLTQPIRCDRPRMIETDRRAIEHESNCRSEEELRPEKRNRRLYS